MATTTTPLQDISPQTVYEKVSETIAAIGPDWKESDDPLQPGYNPATTVDFSFIVEIDWEDARDILPAPGWAQLRGAGRVRILRSTGVDITAIKSTLYSDALIARDALNAARWFDCLTEWRTTRIPTPRRITGDFYETEVAFEAILEYRITH